MKPPSRSLVCEWVKYIKSDNDEEEELENELCIDEGRMKRRMDKKN